jgi:hypothetical protein
MTFISENGCFYEITWQKYCRAEQVTDDNTAHALCVLDNFGYRHAHRICNTYCSSATTMVSERVSILRLYLHCLTYLRQTVSKWWMWFHHVRIVWKKSCPGPLTEPLQMCVYCEIDMEVSVTVSKPPLHPSDILLGRGYQVAIICQSHQHTTSDIRTEWRVNG